MERQNLKRVLQKSEAVVPRPGKMALNGYGSTHATSMNIAHTNDSHKREVHLPLNQQVHTVGHKPTL